MQPLRHRNRRDYSAFQAFADRLRPAADFIFRRPDGYFAALTAGGAVFLRKYPDFAGWPAFVYPGIGNRIPHAHAWYVLYNHF